MKLNYLKLFFFIAIITVITVIICNLKGDAWEEPVRISLYKLSNDSVPAYSKETVDEYGVPYVDYYSLNGVTAGKQYNPTIVCNYAIEYNKQLSRDSESGSSRKFFNCVNWLASHLAYKENYAYYQFNWQQPWYDSVGNPYTSGMTSGLAIQVFTEAYRLTNAPEYLQFAKKLLRGYFIPINQGGFTYKDNNGWWYEELADTAMHTPRILDGHIFAITGVYEYWCVTKDDSANIIISKGIQSLKNSLPDYDIGNGWAFYDGYKKPADKKYQRLLASQMLQLYNITGDTLFKDYHSKWNAPLTRPYFLRIIKEQNRSGIVLLSLVFIAIGVLFLIITIAVARIIAVTKYRNKKPRNKYEV
jgi:heparosan-N-sulfate-glucuronate 5-epimerase